MRLGTPAYGALGGDIGFASVNVNGIRTKTSRPLSNDEKLTVAVRVRPIKADEGERILHILDEKTIVLDDDTDKKDILRQKRSSDKQYTFDFVFGEDSAQEEVYDLTTRSLVRDVLLGYNATVFAYGATGAGKTHTMVGTPTEPGIMVRALNDLFTSIADTDPPHQVKLSYLELYNENIRDLLNPSAGFLELREDSGPLRTPTVAGLTEMEASSINEVMGLVLKGNKERTVEPTAANKTSSRSHALLSVTVTQEEGNERQIGRLYMLDLAGSERASNTKNRGKRLVEGAHINRSLLALGNVINALSGGSGSRYVNYRDSKLTRLLRNALSGNCRTVMISHVSPATANRDETRNTLVYAARASRISNKVEKNELEVNWQVTQYTDMITDLRSEIGRLKSKLDSERPSSAEIRGRSSGTPVKHLREQIIATFREQMKLRRRLMDIDGHLMSLGVEAERQHQIISQWEARRSKLYNRPSSRPNTSAGAENGNSNGTEVGVHEAWSELSYIEREQERFIALRSSSLKELESCREKAISLENDLPEQLDSETEREMLSLLIRVHELEADKVALQGERLVESHELRRRADMLQRFHRQQRLTDEIITRQRHLIEVGKIPLPSDLVELYTLYQQEIHATTFSTDTAGIPYSAYDTLPPIKEVDSILEKRGYTAMIPPTAESEPLRTSTGSTSSSHGGTEWELPRLTTAASHNGANVILLPLDIKTCYCNGAGQRAAPDLSSMTYNCHHEMLIN